MVFKLSLEASRVAGTPASATWRYHSRSTNVANRHTSTTMTASERMRNELGPPRGGLAATAFPAKA